LIGFFAIFGWIYKYVKPYKKWLSIGILCSIFIAGINILKAAFVSQIINSALKIKLGNIYILAGIFILILIAGALVSYLLKYSVGRFGIYAVRDLKDAIIKHISELEIGVIDKIHSGMLVSKFNNNLQVIENFIHNQMVNLFFQPIMILCSLIYMGIINWKLLIFSFILTPVSIYFSNRLGKRMGFLSREYYANLEKSSSIIKDIISGIEIVKAYNLGKHLANQWGFFFEHGKDKAVAIEKCRMFLFPFIIILQEFPGVICILFGGYLTLQGEMNVGELVAFFQVLNYVVNPLIMLPWMISDIRNSGGAIESINHLFLEKPERKTG
jgi:subfamily B ATP-binding cassette protein MsbA